MLSGVPSVTAIVALRKKRLEQTERRGRRISILGLWQPDEGFEYALACGSFNSSSYITVMDWVADKAAKTLAQTERLTVVVQDNGSVQPGDSATVATMAGTGIIPVLLTAVLFPDESD